jgi:16S rRNA (guanine527-N7)-methyltransferase
MDWRKALHNFPLPYGFDAQADAYTALLLRYNQTHNISGAKTREHVYENILDSLYPVTFIGKWPKVSLDIGSGAGFPAIPLALALPYMEVHLFEPIAKKSAFLHLTKAELGLGNIHVKTERIEQATPFSCELIMSRAVTEIKPLVDLAKAFIGPQTQLLLYKGSRASAELEGVEHFTLYERNQRRYVVIKDLV